jgi:hypothetical protein
MMRETLATAPDRQNYINHAKEHYRRIEQAYPAVKALAEAQMRGDPAKGGKAGAIERLKQYDRILRQYEAEFAWWVSMQSGEEVGRPPQFPEPAAGR